MAYIYKITNIITEDTYIGKTKKPIEVRFQKHVYNSKNGKTHLYKAFRKYGVNNFIIETLEEVSIENIDERERFYINNLSPTYNMTKGGDGGYTAQSPNFIQAMKNYHDQKDKSFYATYGMKGKKQSVRFLSTIKEKNSCPVICEGVRYDSVGEAEKAYPNISLRKRLDSPKYPDFYRLRKKTCRK